MCPTEMSVGFLKVWGAVGQVVFFKMNAFNGFHCRYSCTTSTFRGDGARKSEFATSCIFIVSAN